MTKLLLELDGRYGQVDGKIYLCETLLEEWDTYDIVKMKLDAYFKPQINVTFEAYYFHPMVQEDGEAVNQFCMSLKSTAARCDFHDVSC